MTSWLWLEISFESCKYRTQKATPPGVVLGRWSSQALKVGGAECATSVEYVELKSEASSCIFLLNANESEN